MILTVISFLFFSASNLFAQDMNAKKMTAVADAKITVVTPETFQDFATENVGGQVETKGMVVHVCKHGGKKMYIIGDDPEKRVKITASDKVSVFEPELDQLF